MENLKIFENEQFGKVDNVFNSFMEETKGIDTNTVCYKKISEKYKPLFKSIDQDVLEGYYSIRDKNFKRDCVWIANRKKEFLENIFKSYTKDQIKELYASSKAFNQPMNSCVYFVKNNYNGQIKIGYTNNISERFNQLKRGFTNIGIEPDLKLIALFATFKKYAPAIEADFHVFFKEHRANGEWFNIDADDIKRMFLTESEQFDCINDVVIDYSYNEWRFLEDIEKDYYVNPEKIYLSIKDKLQAFFVEENKLQAIIDSIYKNKVGFNCFEFKKGDLLKKGVAYKENDKTYDFRKIKEIKYSRQYWKDIILSIEQ